MKSRSLWRKRKDVMKFNDKEAESKARQEAALQTLHDENKRLGLYDGVYAIDTLEQENRLLRARNERLEKELAMYQVQRLGQEIQPEQEPVAMKFKIYKPTVPDPMRQDINDALLPWVYDQSRDSGFVASMWVTPVSTLPPQRKPLTDEQILHFVDTHVGAPSMAYPLDNSDWIIFARAIEAAHNIKE